jgi:MarR family transcriptional regulator, organic hydroperoxide resistance regulator
MIHSMAATISTTRDDAITGFLDAFDAFARAVRRARGVRSAAPDDGLTLSQYALLQGLAERPDARVQELAREAGVTAPTATRILDALERRGVVSRTRALDDRRAVTVKLTAAGRELLERWNDWIRGRQLAFYGAMPTHERELAPELLLRLAALIDEIAAGPNA